MLLRYVSGQKGPLKEPKWDGMLLDIDTDDRVAADRTAAAYAKEHGLRQIRVRDHEWARETLGDRATCIDALPGSEQRRNKSSMTFDGVTYTVIAELEVENDQPTGRTHITFNMDPPPQGYGEIIWEFTGKLPYQQKRRT